MGAALAVALAVALVGPAAAGATPPLTCAAGDPGVHYTAPSNLTVADASNAPMDQPFAGNSSIAIGDVTVSADGTAFARVETAVAETCLSDVDATTVPVTVDTDDTTVTVEGSVDALAFDDPVGDAVALAYRADDGATVTIADAGHPEGTTLQVLGAGTDRKLGKATVGSDGSVPLSLPASDDGTTVELEAVRNQSTPTATPTPVTTSPRETPSPTAITSSPSEPTQTPITPTPTDGELRPGPAPGKAGSGGVPWPLVLGAVALLAIGGGVAYRRR